MSYQVRIARAAVRDLKSLHHDIIKRIDQCIVGLADNPRPPGCRKLKAQTLEAWRIRMGDYRILYTIDDDRKMVSIFRVAHRRDVYDR